MRNKQVRGRGILLLLLFSIAHWFPPAATAQTPGRVGQFNSAPPPPLIDSALNQTTVVSTSDITSDASIFIKGPGPWIDVTSYGAVADSTTDNAGAINTAINACPPSSAAMTSAGCTIYFPYSGTGNYLIKSSINLNTGSTLQDGVRLVGECTSLGTGSTRPTAAPLTCSTIIANNTFTSSDAMLVVGQSTVKTHGFVVQDLGFSDTSTNNSFVPGAMHLINVEDFSLVHPACSAFAAASPNGYCMQFDVAG
jgi:hypothetical protein